jgi:superfamily II DNA or RNA helicase
MNADARIGTAESPRFRLEAKVPITLGRRVLIEKAGLPPAMLARLRRTAAFQNPEFYRRQSLRLSTARTPRVIDCSEDLPDQLSVPRGCLADVREILESAGAELLTRDERTSGGELACVFRGQLTSRQEEMVRAVTEHDIGILVAPPGTGKTVVGIQLVAQRARSTLVLVHRAQLLDQWRAQIGVFLGLDLREIGQIGGGRRIQTGALDVAMIQSLAKRDGVEEMVAGYGHVIVDECHHVPAVSFERVMNAVGARFITGLTATPQRRDGHHPILRYQLGPVRFAADAKAHAGRLGFRRRLLIRETRFHLMEPMAGGIQAVYGELSGNLERNELILDDIIGAVEDGRSPVVLTERKEHLEYLATKLQGFVRHLIVLQGGMGARQKREVARQLASVPETEERVLLATGRFLGEGFDDARLDTLFLTMPVSWKGTLVQYAGRLHRNHSGKEEVRIYDYVDGKVPLLARMFEKRRRGYAAMGYRVVK